MDNYQIQAVSPRQLKHKMTFNPRYQSSNRKIMIQSGVNVSNRQLSPLPSQNNLSMYSATKRLGSREILPAQHLSYVSREQNQIDLGQEDKATYEHIEKIMRSQNRNLKQQNQLLLAQISKLRKTNKKYKDLCLGQQIQLQGVREECEAQKHRADQMKQIISQRMLALEKQCLEQSRMSQPSQVQIQGLTFSNSGMK